MRSFATLRTTELAERFLPSASRRSFVPSISALQNLHIKQHPAIEAPACLAGGLGRTLTQTDGQNDRVAQEETNHEHCHSRRGGWVVELAFVSCSKRRSARAEAHAARQLSCRRRRQPH